jgi:hypothetical protein
MAIGSQLSNLDMLFDTCFTTVLVISVSHLVLSLYGGLNSRVFFFFFFFFGVALRHQYNGRNL